MDKELKTKWLEALRSGEYKQGTGYLEVNCYNCCLGVLCRVADIKTDDVQILESVDAKAFNGSVCSLNNQLLVEFGLEPNQAKTLMRMNDHELLAFTQIADYIEREL